MNIQCKSCNDRGYQVCKATGMLIYCPGLAGGYFPCGECDKGKEKFAEHQAIVQRWEREKWPWWKKTAYAVAVKLGVR